MRTFVIALLTVSLAFASRATAQTPAAPVESQPEIVHVDGAKSPELIPQWSVWGYVFRVISGGPRQLPTSVFLVVSKTEEALVIKEADAVQKIDAGCQVRAAKAAALLGTETMASVDAKVREISVECRWETLRARDRVLAAINPEAAAALVAFAESTKAGTSISLPRKDLARFLEPE
jgi:hypothetical protein